MLLIALILSRALWDPYLAASGSMKPTVLPGDYLLAFHLPRPVARGDVVVFRHPASGAPAVSRVLGLPGETVQMKAGVPFIGGKPVRQRRLEDYIEARAPQGPAGVTPRCVNAPATPAAPCRKWQSLETLPGGVSYRVLDIGPGALDDTPSFVVPNDRVFVLGDNRDNALDSRLPTEAGGVGFLPLAGITGRVERVAFSFSGRRMSHLWTWRGGRFLKAVR